VSWLFYACANRRLWSGQRYDHHPPVYRFRAMLILYQRDDCKLCDEAVALLAAVRVPEFESVWIDDDAQLEARYGERVPVLRDEASGRELDWPFDTETLRAFAGA